MLNFMEYSGVLNTQEGVGCLGTFKTQMLVQTYLPF